MIQALAELLICKAKFSHQNSALWQNMKTLHNFNMNSINKSFNLNKSFKNSKNNRRMNKKLSKRNRKKIKMLKNELPLINNEMNKSLIDLFLIYLLIYLFKSIDMIILARNESTSDY